MLFFVVAATLLAVVGVPLLLAPVLTQMVRDAGVRGGELHVSVGWFDPSLFSGRAGELNIEGRDVTLGPASVGGLDLSLLDASLSDQTFEGVRGNLRDVEMTTGGIRVQVARVEIDGPASAANVASHFTPMQGADIVRQAADRAGVNLDSVAFVDGGLRVTIAGITTRAGIGVEGGGLVLKPGAGPSILLLAPVPSDPWRLSEAWVSPEGITVRGVVNAAALARWATTNP